ncbi:MAG: hypothetical protein KAW49_13530, partial [Anaerolineae bacterium]|nr:hypothetical protein [Anaerolineae bacterium]
MSPVTSPGDVIGIVSSAIDQLESLLRKAEIRRRGLLPNNTVPFPAGRGWRLRDGAAGGGVLRLQFGPVCVACRPA